MENYILKNNTYINVDRIFPATKSDGKENNFGVADIDGEITGTVFFIHFFGK